ncbi:efflux RND transporter periplasmic adaptor subunit [Endozoicomonas euniceicola]|uniref:Efflux RND transporter periplasmic adaptor subunit n=1 Tax=Endozoicomonas euniceicola TaxID=1234143 RepID=A0ABY6GWN0_9GAMM|nr:efflux RND transporter periplasmic adaptor subunit [Endozoicomonas euniceicola]UYM17187.1 efflux RND transporter periplasmic adaptor subunit [Endozoicomonas euniceicola]
MKPITSPPRQRQLLLISFLIASLFALTGCDQQPQQQGQMPAPAVSVIDVTRQPVGDYQEFVARTEAVKTVDLRARVEGFLTKRDFIEGQNVKNGQLLFEIDPKPYEAALKKAEANLTSAKAERTKAVKDLQRSKDLFQKGHISQANLDTQTSNQARAEAAVQAAEAGLETAKLNLGYTHIYAPFAGQIGRATQSVGNLVGPSSGSLATLTTVDPMYVTFQVDERMLVDYLQDTGGERTNNGNFDMRLRLPNGSEYDQPGVFNFADTQVDQTTGTLTLRAQFPNPHGIIIPGMYVTLIAESRNKQDRPVVPQSAIQENQSGRFVLVVNSDNEVETRQVEMGRRMGPFWVVNSGLKAGEQIIVEGLQKVRPGVKVQPNRVTLDPESGAIIMPTQTDTQAQQGK